MAPEHPASEPPGLPRPHVDLDWRERADRWRERAVDLLGHYDIARKALGLLALVATAVAMWMVVRPPPASTPIEAFLPPVEPVAASPTVVNADVVIVVHVAGAVLGPGLVELPLGARVADAVAAAGGATDEADLDRVNLATVLRDADRVAVPRVGEVLSAVEPGGVGVESTGPIDLNRASPAELESLPGVGPATAAAIVAHRDEHGPFTSVSELDNVAGIGPAKLAQLRDLVTVAP